MTTGNSHQGYEQRLKRLIVGPKLLWGTMLASLFILTSVASLAAQRAPSREQIEAAQQLEMPFGIVAVVLGFFVLAFRAKLSSPTVASSIQATIASAPLNGLTNLTPQQDERLQTLQRKYVIFILAMAMAEAVGILGFVLAKSSHSLEPMMPFLVGAAVLMLSLFPQPTKW